MIKLIRANIPLIIIILAAIFFYTFRLQQTFVMAGDTSRDLLDIMKIWQNKTITIVGEPVNTISVNPIQILSGSLSLYIGLVGLIVTGFNPAGSVLVDLLLTIFSIPFFYLLSEMFLHKRWLALFSTLIYALSPITVALTRSFWQPNIELPLSVFVWFLFLYKKSQLRYFLAGIITGAIFNIHYMNFVPVGFYIILLLFRKDKKPFLITFAGLILASVPLIAFEIKNHFYLTNALIGTLAGFSTFAGRTLNPLFSMDVFLYIFGLGPFQYFFPSLVNLDFSIRIIIDTIIGIVFLFFLLKKQKVFNREIVGVILMSLFVGWFFEKFNLLALRYMLSIFPLLTITFVAFISSLNKYLLFLPVIPMIVLSLKIISHKPDPDVREDYLPLAKVEQISEAIDIDNPTGRYNVTENILGDARSLAFRFYLLRDAKVKPQPVEVYDRIDTLYVITPSLDKTYKEDRWEFSASGPKKIEWEKDFGEFKLYKFIK